MSNILLIHGSWHGGWCWDEVKASLEKDGHTVLAPTLLEMDYRKQPPARGIGLVEHINSLKKIITELDLTNLIIVGHSYGGMVMTGLSLLIPDRIKKIVYLDAFLPNPGESLFDISAPERVQTMKKSLVDEDGKTLEQGGVDPYLLPVRDPEFFGIYDQSIKDAIKDKLVKTSVKTFTDKIGTGEVSADIKKYYIRCTQFPISERFENKAKAMKYECYGFDAGHDVMLTNPNLLVNLLTKIIDKNK